MKKIIPIIFCLVIFQAAISQNENADAEYQVIKKEYTLNEDGSSDYREYKQVKLHTHYAFHRLYGETFIIYNTEYQTLKFNKAYTIMADGKKIATPDNAFNQVLPRFANNAPAYNHIREMVVTHTGLEVGAVIHLDYSIHTKKGFYPALMIDEILTETSPVNQLEIKVNVPESATFNYALMNISGEPEINTTSGLKTYTWTFENLPASSKDSYQVQKHLDVPRLFASTAKNNEAIWNWFTNQDGFRSDKTSCMAKTVEKLCCKTSDPLSSALALQKAIVTDLDNIAVPLKYTGFIFRSPADVWNSNQGTSVEKAVLLATMLKSADIEAVPVGIIPQQKMNPEIGNLMAFDDFAVLLELDDFGKILLSVHQTNKNNLILNLQDKSVVAFSGNNIVVEPFLAKEIHDKILLTGDLIFSENGPLTGNLNLALGGYSNPYFKLYQDPESIKSAVNGGLGSKDLTEIKTVELSQENSRTMIKVRKEEPLKALNQYFQFGIPEVNGGVSSWNYNLLTTERNVDLEIPGIIHEKYAYKISYPENLQPVIKQVNIELENDAGYLHISIDKDEQNISFAKEIKLEKRIISPEDYVGFKAIMDAWNNPHTDKVIFKEM